MSTKEILPQFSTIELPTPDPSQIFLCLPGGKKIPARFDVFKNPYGGVYLSIIAEGEHVALSGPAGAMLAELSRAAREVG